MVNDIIESAVFSTTVISAIGLATVGGRSFVTVTVKVSVTVLPADSASTTISASPIESATNDKLSSLPIILTVTSVSFELFFTDLTISASSLSASVNTLVNDITESAVFSNTIMSAIGLATTGRSSATTYILSILK